MSKTIIAKASLGCCIGNLEEYMEFPSDITEEEINQEVQAWGEENLETWWEEDEEVDFSEDLEDDEDFEEEE